MNTVVYIKDSANTAKKLEPIVSASNVTINDIDGNASDVSAEIAALRSMSPGINTGIYQYTEMPAVNALLKGTVCQYIGATSNGATHGCFYECVEDNTTSPVSYSWEQVSVGYGEYLQVSGGAMTGDIDMGNHNITNINNLKDLIRDLFYPIGSRYIQIDSITPATKFGGTWEVDTNYNGRTLWCDSTKTVGTSIAQALPKPAITSTFSGSSVTTSSNTHNHSFTGSQVTTGNQSANHNHSFSGTAVTSGTQSANHSHNVTITGECGGISANAVWSTSSAHSGALSIDQSTKLSTCSNVSKSGTNDAWAVYLNVNQNTGTNNANHTHSVTAAGTIGNNSANHTHNVTASGTIGNNTHSHTVTASGTVTSTVNTSGAYGTGSIVQPPAMSVIVWVRTA